MNATPAATETSAVLARETGFSECALAVRRALATTPVGWLVAAWFCWDRVPGAALALWLGIAGLTWAGSLALLQRTIRAGARLAVHRDRLYWIAGLDGFAWGSLTWFLTGHDPVLDAMLMALLCGVASINAQMYGTYVRAYYAQLGILWLVAVSGLLRSGGGREALDYAIGLTVFFALTGYYTRAISLRLLDGIRLQHANASLAAQLRGALQEVERDAATDALTGHWNRRALDELLTRQFERRAATGRALSILVLDIDHFKKINDEFGHLVGDDVLRAFAQSLREFLRADDSCARFGGEEFVVVLPDTGLAAALDIGERIRAGIARSPLLERPKVQVSVSIGVASADRERSANELLAAADVALYRAKHEGRNRVRAQAAMASPAGAA